jgi:hypothetical protein
MKIKSITLYRMVGFTNSYYMSGGREIGWSGEFYKTPDEAEEAGVGANGMESSSEIREYRLEDHGDTWRVFVNGDEGTDRVHDEVVSAAIRLGLATEEGIVE